MNTPNPDRRIGEEKPMNTNQTSEAGEIPPDLIPLHENAVALAGEHGRIQGYSLRKLIERVAKAENAESHLRAQLAEAEKVNSEAWTALGECTCLMDPPDGGEPTLALLVGRMREEWKKAATERDALRGQLAEVEKELTKERSTCSGTLCAMCTKKPADSHDGCRLRAAEALRESLEAAERRAGCAADHERHWRKVAEDEVARLKAKELRMSNELVAYEKESFGTSLAPRVAELIAERDAAQARVGEMEKALRDAAESLYELVKDAKHFASEDKGAPEESHTLFFSVDEAEGALDRIDAALATFPHRLAGRGDR